MGKSGVSILWEISNKSDSAIPVFCTVTCFCPKYGDIRATQREIHANILNMKDVVIRLLTKEEFLKKLFGSTFKLFSRLTNIMEAGIMRKINNPKMGFSKITINPLIQFSV